MSKIPEYDFSDFCPETVAEWILNRACNGASDEEFAETMMLIEKGRHLDCNEAMPPLTKEDMQDADVNGLCDWIKRCLDEVIFGEEIDPSCWWKQDIA